MLGRSQLPLITFAILIVFALILQGVDEYSFWIDEGYSAWVVRDEGRAPETQRQAIRYVRDDFQITFDRIRADVHPPLYYLLLNTWATLVGHTAYSLRLHSVLMALIALATVYSLGRHLFDHRVGLIALIILGTSGFYLYYAREARMYGLYLALVCMSSYLYMRWWSKPSLKLALAYGLVTTLLLYTHYTSFTLILVQIIFTFITFRRWSQKVIWSQALILFGIPIWLFIPWLPSFMTQWQINTSFEAPAALQSDWGTIAAIWLIITSGYWGIFAITIILSRRLYKLGKSIHLLGLLLLWFLLPVIILFTINAQGISVLQIRYLIPILPAWCLLIAYVLSDIQLPFVKIRYVNAILMVIFTGWIAYTQLANYRTFWSPKPDWRNVASAIAENREPLEPAMVYLDERSPLIFYDDTYDILAGVSIRLNWRGFSPTEVRQIADNLDDNEAVWLMAETQAPETWDAVAVLSENRGIIYRDSVQGTVAYQFDEISDEELKFSFGMSQDNIVFTSQNELGAQYTTSVGEELCIPINLQTQAAVSDTYHVRLSLTRGYHEILEQSKILLNDMNDDDTIEQILCVTPLEVGEFHLRLTIENQETEQNLFVLETGHLWGNYLMLGTVEVTP